MRIEVERPRPDQVVLRPLGRMDATNAPLLKEELQQVIKGNPTRVIVDMAGVDFIDSSGLSTLVTGMKALRRQGATLSLSRPHPQALTALRLTMLDRVFEIFASVEEALG
jgi:anti-anti-sigma factor